LGSNTRNGSAEALLRLLLVASLAVPVLLFTFASWLTHRTILADAERDAGRVAEVAREHAAKVFDTHKLVADHANDILRGMGDAAIRGAAPLLRNRLKGLIAGLPQVAGVAVLDARGHLLISTGAPVDGMDVDLSETDYFMALKDGSLRTFVSDLHRGLAGGGPFFGLARRRSGPDGSFEGVVIADVSPGFFESFWQTLIGAEQSDAPETMVTLVRNDGQVLARYPPLPGPPPHIPPTNQLMQAIPVQPEAGTYVGPSLVGGSERHFAYRHVSNWPVYVAAGHSTSAILADWRATMAPHLLFGLPATIALFLVTRSAMVRTRREQRALAQARHAVAQRDAAEAALLQAQRMDAVGQLTGGVAHDFNNILTIIIGNLEMIGRAPERHDRVKRLIEGGMIAARRGAELTTKLLAFSRRQMVRPETVDVNALLQTFGPVLDHAATEAVTVTLDLTPQPDPAWLDAGQFEAAMLNLVGNARDAMPDGGRLRIETRNATLTAHDVATMPGAAPGPYIRIAVMDNGTGMAPEIAARAFEPFFTTKEVGRGTGLGLSQVYGFCKQAGGHVRIISAPGEGTTVVMFLPRSAEVPLRRPALEALPFRRATEGEVVLVVEDEAAVLEMAVENLGELGYVTCSARNAQEALNLLRQDIRIDILFSDVVMPGGMNGLQLAVEARRLRSGLKVLLTSGYTASVEGSDVPVDVPLLSKPYRRDDLASKLRVLSSS
jgi:signal transduction histidine kinase/CheY-like chemotaxis protein